MQLNDNDLSATNEAILAKLNALLALNLRILLQDSDFSAKRKRKPGASDLVSYFAKFGLDSKDIAQILGTPIQSVRTLLTPKRRKK